MAEDQEAAAKLKARLDRWHAYNQQSQTEVEVTQQPRPDTNYDSLGNIEYAADAKMHTASTSLTPRVSRHSAVAAEAAGLTAEPHSQIADLRAAIEHERERNQHLAQTIQREQALHFITLKSEKFERPAPPPPPPLPDYPSDLFAQNAGVKPTIAARIVPFIVGALLILALWALFNFVL